jgi:hypothetical protein
MAATAENVANLASEVKHNCESTTAFVFDILGNGSVRFEQFDGTYSLPFKSHGSYHLGEKVVTTSPATFKKLVENVLPVLKAKGDKPCIIIPPLPRHLFTRCCSDNGHCTNVNELEFSAEMLSGFIKQKNELIKLLVQGGLTNFKVMDTCCTTSCVQTANIQNRLAELKKVLSDDGVHYTVIRRKNLAERTIKCLGTVLTTAKKPAKHTTFFWRGYRSMRGSALPRAATGANCHPAGNQFWGTLRGRARGGHHGSHAKGFHPYRRW